MKTLQVRKKTRMRIQEGRVLIISDAAPHRNGVGAYYADLIDDLKDQVERIEMISPEIVGNEWQGAWMLPLPGDKTQKLCIPNAMEISRRISDFHPEVVIIPTPGLFGLIGALLARKHGIPVICGFHTWFEKLAGLYWNRVQGGVTRTFFEYVNKALFKLSDVVLANSHEMVEIARSNGAESAQLMGTPITKEMMTQPLKPAPKNVNKVLFIGRLAAEKNVSAIIEAAKKQGNMQFTIAGAGPEQEKLMAQARGLRNVEFLGWVSRDKVIELLDSHDALVLPSTVESFGTVAMEAMMRQRLVIVSSACGITEWTDLRNGITVIPESSGLDEVLAKSAELSEFEMFSRCHIARKVALEHVVWNQNLWLDHIDQLHEGQQNEDEEPFLTRLRKLSGVKR